VLNNDETLEDLKIKVKEMINEWLSKEI
jgi:hypothetical protein